MKSSVTKHPSMTRSFQTDPIAVMQAEKALMVGGPDKPAGPIVDFRSGEARCVRASAAHCNRSSSIAVEADATTLLLLAQCVP
jgi:hypothetical protein